MRTGGAEAAAAAVVTGVVLLAAVGCDGGPTAPTRAEVAGSYRATTLTVTDDDSVVDALAVGASLDVVLEDDGTTTGSFVVPGRLSESGQRESFDLAGTWTLSGDTVAFDHPADTFLRDMPFVFDGDRLVGEESFGSETVRAVLEGR